MALPKIQLPTFEVSMVSQKGKKITCRPMIVKEEKILLMAKESQDRHDHVNAIKQVVQNCIIDKVDVDNIPYFEMEWIFLKIRENSVSNIANVAYQDSDDEKTRPFKIDLKDVVVKFPENSNNVFKLPDEIVVTLNHPSVKMHTSKQFFDAKNEDLMVFVISQCIASIHQGDKTFNLKTTKAEELMEFVESIPSNIFAEMQTFLNELPHLYYKIEYKNDKGADRTIELTTLDDFFTFA